MFYEKNRSTDAIIADPQQSETLDLEHPMSTTDRYLSVPGIQSALSLGHSCRTIVSGKCYANQTDANNRQNAISWITTEGACKAYNAANVWVTQRSGPKDVPHGPLWDGIR